MTGHDIFGMENSNNLYWLDWNYLNAEMLAPMESNA
jgi:hypothetical protein